MKLRWILVSMLLSLMIAVPASSQVLREEQMAAISATARKAIQTGKIPGAVILIGSQGKVVYCKAFGFRELKPKKSPMTTDTIFDMASLTKVIATSTAVMQLVENGKLNLEAPVAKYWPEFKGSGKEEKIGRAHV